jgi:hypothetical protein
MIDDKRSVVDSLPCLLRHSCAGRFRWLGGADGPLPTFLRAGRLDCVGSGAEPLAAE